MNAGPTNVKIPKDGVLGWWTTDCGLQRGSDGFPYALTMKTHIYDFEKERKVTLEKYLQQYQDTICIYKYKEFPPGDFPKVLVQEDEKTTYQFGSTAKDNVVKDAVLASCVVVFASPFRQFFVMTSARHQL